MVQGGGDTHQLKIKPCKPNGTSATVVMDVENVTPRDLMKSSSLKSPSRLPTAHPLSLVCSPNGDAGVFGGLRLCVDVKAAIFRLRYSSC